MIYNLTAEYAALIITTVLVMSFVWHKELNTTRHRMFKLLYRATLFSILVTIATTLTSQYFMIFPLWLVEALKALYFITSPIATLFCFFYAVALTHTNVSAKSFNNKLMILLIPYIAYTTFILANYIFHHVFIISPEEGYVRGQFYQCTYVIAAIYILGIITITLMNRKTIHKSITLIICLNMVVSILITGFQFFNSHVLLSGFASITGILIIYIYVQNSKNITDTLTLLLNRQTLMFNMHKLVKSKASFSLYVFSIRNFKGINDQYGIDVGDATLVSISKEFIKHFEYTSIYRYSGDEFAVLSTKTDNTFQQTVDLFVKQFEKNIIVDDKLINFAFVYTRVDFPDFSTDVQTLVSTADYAISRLKSKTHVSNYLYSIEIRDEMKRIQHVISVIKYAIKHNDFEIYFQPIYNTKTNTFKHAEAMVRIKDSIDESITPEEFIPIAEKNGLIIPLTYIIFEHACKSFRSFLDTFGTSIQLQTISIKFPYAIFFQSDMPNKVITTMKKYNIKPEQVHIEITERSLETDDGTVRNAVLKMEKAGFTFELGEFGVEHSNTNTFLTLPIQFVKIDRGLMLNAVAQRHYRAFFKNLVQGIQAIGKSVIVEGVEENEHRDFIVQCGCEYIQGSVYFNPLSLENFKKFLAAQQRKVIPSKEESFDNLKSFLTSVRTQ